MIQWQIKEQKLNLKFNWKISRGQSQDKILYTIKAQKGHLFGRGEIAGLTNNERNSGQIAQIFQSLPQAALQNQKSIDHLTIPTHLKMGLSGAIADLERQTMGCSWSEYLKVPKPLPVATSFSFPIMELSNLESFFIQHGLNRFKALKVKINRHNGVETLQEIRQFFKGPLRVDANEDFLKYEDVLNFLEKVDTTNLECLEQPLPVKSWNESKALKLRAPIPIFADEDLQDEDITSQLTEAYHGINIKLMKAGSLQQALKQKQQAQKQGLKTMLGCMVETSLGISLALQIAAEFDCIDLDGFLFFKEEPFKLVHEENGLLSLVND